MRENKQVNVTYSTESLPDILREYGADSFQIKYVEE